MEVEEALAGLDGSETSDALDSASPSTELALDEYADTELAVDEAVFDLARGPEFARFLLR